MKKLADSSIVEIEERSEGIVLPVSVDTVCPYCLKQVNFSIKWPNYIDTEVAYARSRCSGCGENPKFMLFDLPMRDGNDDEIGDLYISPAPDIKDVNKDISRIEEFSVGLKKHIHQQLTFLI